ncbi:MAG: hypothetical protein ABFS18_09590 [Thermodesulfobacteriota bacterium]
MIRMMENKIFRLFWVVLLVVSAFTLGYTLKPKTSRRPPSLDMKSMTGRFPMPAGRTMPNFRRR